MKDDVKRQREAFRRRLNVAIAITGLSPVDIAGRLGVTRASVHNWVHGKHLPMDNHSPVDTVLLCRVLGCDPEWLLRSEFPKYEEIK